MATVSELSVPAAAYPAGAGDGTVLRVQATTGWAALKLGELWEYRELLYFLVWRDIKVRYKQTALGAAWAILQPLLTMLIFSLFFGRLARMPSDGIPYPLFAYTALVPWTFFAQGLTHSAESLVGSSNLIRKVYFPRLVIPMGAVFAGLVDFALAFLMLIWLMAKYRTEPTWNLLWLPVFVTLALATSLGAGLLLSALNVQYRDVRYTVPFLVQFWMFATPIVYPSSMVPAAWRVWYGLNPMAGVVEGFRWSLLGAGAAPGPMTWVSAAVALLLLAGGALYFRRTERAFADLI